jgi:hypothetical protein
VVEDHESEQEQPGATLLLLFDFFFLLFFWPHIFWAKKKVHPTLEVTKDLPLYLEFTGVFEFE